ncbi:DUF47 family protein [bacterium]|nr:DUF47 family protein [bacterium]
MKFKFLEKLLPPENKVFYDCFENAAKNCNDAAKLFNKALTEGMNEDLVVKAKTLKHRGSDYERETIGLLNSTFITPIDREDIQELAILLNSITKKITKAFMNVNVYRLATITDEMLQQSKIIISATTELMEIVGLLKTISKTDEITISRDAMKEIEAFGDGILFKAMDKLFSGQFEAIEVIKLRDIYKDLERALDRCYSVSDSILNIALKNN